MRNNYCVFFHMHQVAATLLVMYSLVGQTHLVPQILLSPCVHLRPDSDCIHQLVLRVRLIPIMAQKQGDWKTSCCNPFGKAHKNVRKPHAAKHVVTLAACYNCDERGGMHQCTLQSANPSKSTGSAIDRNEGILLKDFASQIIFYSSLVLGTE